MKKIVLVFGLLIITTFVFLFIHNKKESDVSVRIPVVIESQYKVMPIKKVSKYMYKIALQEYNEINKEIKKYNNTSFESENEKEKAFIVLKNSLEQSAQRINQEYEKSGYEIYFMADNEKENNEVIKQFNDIGYTFHSLGEGFVEFVPYYPFLSKNINLPNSCIEYLYFLQDKFNHFGEGGIYLHTDESISVLIKYDKFLKQYPNFIEIEKIKKDFDIYFSDFIYGMDHDQADTLSDIDPNTGKIWMKPRYRKAIEQFIKENSDFSRIDEVKKQYEKIKNNNFLINNELKFRL